MGEGAKLCVYSPGSIPVSCIPAEAQQFSYHFASLTMWPQALACLCDTCEPLGQDYAPIWTNNRRVYMKRKVSHGRQVYIWVYYTWEAHAWADEVLPCCGQAPMFGLSGEWKLHSSSMSWLMVKNVSGFPALVLILFSQGFGVRLSHIVRRLYQCESQAGGAAAKPCGCILMARTGVRQAYTTK
jgi:hypothetical protein